jgi:hypothetical protein
MCFTDCNDVGIDISQKCTFPQQPARVANPDGPTGLIGWNWTRLVGFADPAGKAEKHQKDQPKLCKHSWH